MFYDNKNGVEIEYVTERAIEFQTDVEFIEELTESFSDIIDVTNSTDGDNASIYKKRAVRSALTRIDNSLLKRFGVPVKHITGDFMGYACTPIHAKASNVLMDDINARLGELSVIANSDTKGCSEKECVEHYQKDMAGLAKGMQQSYKDLSVKLNTTGIKVDFKNATMSGISMTIYSIIDFDYIIRDKELTARELTAVLMHEMGHMFTHISETYRTIDQGGLIIDAINESKGDTFDSSIRYLHKKLIGTTPKIHEKDTTQVLIDLNREISNKGVAELAVESERMADEFASRFGLGKEIGTSLEKLTTSRNTLFSYSNISINGTLLRLLILFTIVTNGMLVMAALILSLYVVVGATIGYVIITMISSGEKSSFKTYDTNLRRLVRLKQNEIRLLRTVEGSDEFKDDRIRAIKEIGRIIRNTPDENFIEKASYLLPWNYSKAKDTDERRVNEKLVDNDIHWIIENIKGKDNE